MNFRRAANIKKYKVGFDIWGFVLFVVIMIPNFIWFAVPAPNDILRNDSMTPTLDMIAQIFQVLMVVTLCTIINTQREQPMSRENRLGIALFVALYFGGWILYYTGITNVVIVLDLCIAPCMAFIFYSNAKKNCFSLISAVIFMVCHLIYGIVNFIV